jgi:trans-2,3-dihydro-3-hydroxyanthranilate isomerase
VHRTYDFVQLDVFTQMRFRGNPLAIFPNASGMSDHEMQALAKEMNLSETTFIVPRDSLTEDRDGKKVRIFTVEEELPFAGHPTLGTALYLHALQSNINAKSRDQITLDLPAGKITVRVEDGSDTAGEGRVNGSVFGEMRQLDPEFGCILSRDDVARVIGVEVGEIPAEWPCQVVSTGLPFAIVPLSKLQTLAKLKPSSAGSELLEGTGARFCYFLCSEAGNGHLEARARMFFYGGEDPATGSAAGCAAAWMAKYGIAKSDERVLIRQGVEMNRPSEIFVRATSQGEQISNVRVGGHAVEVLRGTATL